MSHFERTPGGEEASYEAQQMMSPPLRPVQTEVKAFLDDTIGDAGGRVQRVIDHQ